MLAMYMFSFSPLDISKFTPLSALYPTMSNVWCFYIHGCLFIPWSMVNLTGTISLKKTKSTFSIHQLLIAFYLKTGVNEPLHPPFSTCYHPFSILVAEMLSCLILCRSHADKPQLMSAILLSYLEDTVLCLYSTTLFLCNIIVAVFVPTANMARIHTVKLHGRDDVSHLNTPISKYFIFSSLKNYYQMFSLMNSSLNNFTNF